MAKKMRASATAEPVGYAEVGTYLHKNPGKATVKTYTSCNEPLKVDAAVETQQIKKIRVETHVYEDKSVNQNVVYQKDVETIQLSDGETPVSGSNFKTEAATPEESTTPSSDPLSKGERMLKNMIKSNTAWMILVAAVAILAFGIGMAALFK